MLIVEVITVITVIVVLVIIVDRSNRLVVGVFGIAAATTDTVLVETASFESDGYFPVVRYIITGIVSSIDN